MRPRPPGAQPVRREPHRDREPRPRATILLSAVLAASVLACGAAPSQPPTASNSVTTAARASISGVGGAAAADGGAATASPGPGGSPAPAPAVAARLSAALLRIRAVDHLPGVQAAVGYGDGWTWNGHAGFADLADHQPVSTTTLFDVGSITKTFVAALTLQLADQGVLGLSDPLSRWLPGAAGNSSATIRELLDHTSGIDDPFAHPSLLAALGAHPRVPWTPARVLRYVGKPHFAPGRGWYYSNANYLLLGQILQEATGQSVATLIRRRFLDPLGMSHTFLQGEEPVTGPAALGYDAAANTTWALTDLSDGSPYLPFTSLATALGTAGAVVSTAGDLSRWAEALYGGRVLRAAALSEMLDFGLTRGLHPRWPYGLGVQEVTFHGQVSWGHSGLLSGYHAAMRYFPATGLTIVVLVNDDTTNPDALVAALLDALDASGGAAAPGSPAPSPSAAGTP
jgi:D-alanyl-D-alanine carboxypeptidase